MNKFTPNTNGILNFTENVIKDYQTNLETFKFNEYTLKDNIQEFKNIDNIIPSIKNNLFKQINLFKGTYNNIVYVSKIFGLDVLKIEQNDNTYKKDGNTIYCKELLLYNGKYTYDNNFNYNDNGCIFYEDGEGFCGLIIKGEVSLDLPKLVDYTMIAKKLADTFEERLYACAWIKEIDVPLVGHSYYVDFDKIETKTKEKLKSTIKDNKYSYYGCGMKYNNKCRDTKFHYGDNYKLLSSFKFTKRFKDKIQIYYDGKHLYNSNFYYTYDFNDDDKIIIKNKPYTDKYDYDLDENSNIKLNQNLKDNEIGYYNGKSYYNRNDLLYKLIEKDKSNVIINIKPYESENQIYYNGKHLYNSNIKYNQIITDDIKPIIKKTFRKKYISDNQMYYKKDSLYDLYYGNLDVKYNNEDTYVLIKEI